MNSIPIKKISVAFAAAAVLAGSGIAYAQTQDLTLDSFDTGNQGSAPSGVGIWYGSCSAVWDGTQDNTGNGGGSLYISCLDDNTSDTPLNPYICMGGGNPWYLASSVDLSLYKSIEFDIKWDNTSALTVDEFNNVATWPATYGTPVGQFNGDPNSHAFNIKAVTGGNGTFVQLGSTNIPTAASNGWQHISFPIDATIAGLGTCNGIDLEKWDANSGSIVGEPTAKFWIDNIVLKGTAGPPPPPTVKLPTKAVAGLNVFSSTQGLYDRQEAELMQSSGLSWVGQATSAKPVSYSFTIVGYPNSYNCEAYLFLTPNPAANDSAPDWNETNCAIFYLQGNASSSYAHFQYKVNEPGGNTMYGGGAPYTNAPGSWDGVTPNYLESGNLATLPVSVGIYGTWTLAFSSNTNGTIIAPDGTSTNFVVPPYNTGYFTEQTTPGFNVYLGMQANAADGLNQAVVYGSFAVSNSATPFSENFLTDSVLDTTNTWRTSVAAGPKGVLIVPSNAAYWVDWTLPATGYSLQTSPVLNAPLDWSVPSTFPSVLALVGMQAQLVATNDLTAGSAVFFDLIKREATQLQVLLPGETNAPNTTLGKVGTPATAAVGAEVDVTFNLVDATFHIISAVDALNITTTDSSASISTGTPNLAAGTVTVPIYFNQSGSFTVSASDTTETNIVAGTSSTITVQ
jgi:hypothetical protein